MKVIKRDDTLEQFDKNKIKIAIIKSMKTSIGIKSELAEKISNEIEYECNKKNKEEISIYDIEKIVYDKLIDNKLSLVAKSYEDYRSIREFQRECDNSTDEEVIEMLKGTSEYWTNENSNKNSKIQNVKRDYLAGILSTDIARRFMMPPDLTQAHDEGIIHQHDMDYIGQGGITNCCLINLEDMLQNGTVINNVKIDKPHTLKTATTITTQIITSVASSQYGGCTITLTHLAPFVRDSYNKYIKKYKEWGFDSNKCEEYARLDLKKEIEDSVQTFNYQVNSMSTTNGQAPFLSVYMYLNETTKYKKELAMLIEEFLKQRIKGIKNEAGVYVTQTFPKLIYALESDNICEGTPYYYLTKLSAECTAKRFVPDYVSEKITKKYKENTCPPSMGCRSWLPPYKDSDGNYKYYGRFNCGVCTINLFDVALSSNGDYDSFWQLMEERSELVHRALQVKLNSIKGTLSDVAPILWQNGAFARLQKHEPIDKLLYNGYCTISYGYAGLYECVKFMTGNSHSDGSIGEKFGLEVMQFINDKCNQWYKEEGIQYSVYGSPIESTTYKFAKCLKKRFGNDVFTKLDKKDRNYITNSYHLPVFEKINAYDKLSIESKFQGLSIGGAISYIEAVNTSQNIDSVLNIMKFIYNNIPYAEINIKTDFCQVCGYTGEIKLDSNLEWYCPNCGNKDHDKMNVVRRTCGYLGSNFWNKGRTNEISDRYVHLDNHEYKGCD
jgi:ribonucleoside-triphosphate reductase